MRSALAILLLATAFAASLAAQVTCRDCANQGTLPCTKHGKKDEVEREREQNGTLFCSVVADCKACAGALAVDCKHCRNESAEQALAARQQLVADWRAERRRAVVDPIGEPKTSPLFLRTPHCELTLSIKSLTVGKKKFDTHDLLHLYGQRIEELRALFVATFELTDADLPGVLSVFVFQDAEDHKLLCPQVTGIGGGGNRVKLMGVPCVLCMWHDKRDAVDDEALHRQIVHNVTHLLFSNMTPSYWIGNRKHGWVDAGVAHWFEDKVTGKCANFCHDELLLQHGASFKGGLWRPPVRKLVDAGTVLPFAELSTRNTDQLTFEEHAIAFAYVDFLLSVHGGAKFRAFAGQLKDKVPTRDALQNTYGLNPLNIDGMFQEWVKENYSPLVRR
ncbi:MAG: hypothetical protein KDE27_24510 [Planctomycetes bacterium]|nr:hypothetical protein [Planctomycetota bacterium]